MISEEVGGIDEAGDEDKAEKLLARPLLQPIETHVVEMSIDLGQPKKSQERSHIAHRTFVIDKKKGGGDCWGY